MSASSRQPDDSESKDDNKPCFECNICFDTAKDAVVSQCGHLFCWPCIHQWLETKRSNPQCPVCKSAISRDKVTPIYGKGSGTTDPRTKAPPRPAGQREEPRENPGFAGFGAPMEGFQMSFGIGAFPFGLFATTFNTNGGQRQEQGTEPGARAAGPLPARDEAFLSQMFIMLAVVFVIWLILV